MEPEADKRLWQFARDYRMLTKGGLGVALVVTKHALDRGLPVDPSTLLTPGGGQVLGLGKGAVQAILRAHDIHRVLAEEGGRTSRGSIGRMQAYVDFLNTLDTHGQVNLDAILAWWVCRVREFFERKPLVLRLDPARSLSASVTDLLAQAERRQAEAHGATYLGTVLQHLVGAKLALVCGEEVEHHGASVADGPSGRPGDFRLGDVSVHVTTAPSEGLLAKCVANLESGLRPVIVTLKKSQDGALYLASQQGVADRVDVFTVEQLVAGNLYELGRFAPAGRENTAEQLVAKYNEIVEAHESDPSLRIEGPR